MFSNITKLFTNFIEVIFKPIKSSVTKTWPSQCKEKPIPIVEFLVVCNFFCKFVSIHSNTIENTHFFEVTVRQQMDFSF